MIWPGPAPQARDLTAPTRTDGFGEGTQDRTVQGSLAQRVPEQIRVGVRGVVVTVAGGTEGIVFGHARDTSF